MSQVKNTKVALIGAGKMGSFHLRVLKALGVLCGVMDLDKETLDEIKRNYDVPVFSTVQTLMETIQPDGVVIAVPTKFHYPTATEVLQYPSVKAILLEKPVARTLKEALNLKQLAKQHNKRIVVGHIEVYNPVVSRMIDIAKENLGEIHNISFQRRGAVSDRRLPSIGDIFEDLGVHDFDIAAKLIKGEVTLSCASLKKNGFHNTTTIVMDSAEKNVVCSFLLSREFAGKRRKIQIEGSKATMHVDLIAQTIKLRGLGQTTHDAVSVSVPFKGGQLVKSYGEPLQEELLDLLATIQDENHTPKVGIDDGINTLSIVEAARKSLEQSDFVSVELI